MQFWSFLQDYEQHGWWWECGFTRVDGVDGDSQDTDDEKMPDLQWVLVSLYSEKEK